MKKEWVMGNGRGGLSGVSKFNLPWMAQKAEEREQTDLEGEVPPVVPMRRVEKPQESQSAAVMKMLERGAAYLRGEVDENGRVSLEGTTDKPAVPMRWGEKSTQTKGASKSDHASGRETNWYADRLPEIPLKGARKQYRGLLMTDAPPNTRMPTQEEMRNLPDKSFMRPGSSEKQGPLISRGLKTPVEPVSKKGKELVERIRREAEEARKPLPWNHQPPRSGAGIPQTKPYAGGLEQAYLDAEKRNEEGQRALRIINGGVASPDAKEHARGVLKGLGYTVNPDGAIEQLKGNSWDSQKGELDRMRSQGRIKRDVTSFDRAVDAQLRRDPAYFYLSDKEKIDRFNGLAQRLSGGKAAIIEYDERENPGDHQRARIAAQLEHESHPEWNIPRDEVPALRHALTLKERGMTEDEYQRMQKQRSQADNLPGATLAGGFVKGSTGAVGKIAGIFSQDAADGIKNYGEDAAAGLMNDEHKVMGAVGEFAGEATVDLALDAVPGGGVVGVLAEGVDAYHEARKAGLSHEESLNYGIKKGAINGASSAVTHGAGKALDSTPWGKTLKDDVTPNSWKKSVGQYGKETVGGMVGSEVKQLSGNQVDQAIDPRTEWDKGLWEAGVAPIFDGLLPAGTKGVMDAIRAQRSNTSDQNLKVKVDDPIRTPAGDNPKAPKAQGHADKATELGRDPLGDGVEGESDSNERNQEEVPPRPEHPQIPNGPPGMVPPQVPNGPAEVVPPYVPNGPSGMVPSAGFSGDPSKNPEPGKQSSTPVTGGNDRSEDQSNKGLAPEPAKPDHLGNLPVDFDEVAKRTGGPKEPGYVSGYKIGVGDAPLGEVLKGKSESDRKSIIQGWEAATGKRFNAESGVNSNLPAGTYRDKKGVLRDVETDRVSFEEEGEGAGNDDLLNDPEPEAPSAMSNRIRSAQERSGLRRAVGSLEFSDEVTPPRRREPLLSPGYIRRKLKSGEDLGLPGTTQTPEVLIPRRHQGWNESSAGLYLDRNGVLRHSNGNVYLGGDLP
jgi:hypothetical protein